MSQELLCPNSQAVLQAYDDIVALRAHVHDTTMQVVLIDAQIYRFQRVIDAVLDCCSHYFDDAELEDVHSHYDLVQKIAQAEVLTEEALELLGAVVAFSESLPYLQDEERAEALKDLPDVYEHARTLLEGLCSEDGESCS